MRAPDDALDLTAPETVRDPYPLYARLRRDRPVAPLRGGGYLLTRYADVKAALAHPALGNAPSRFSVLHASKAGRHEAARMARNLLPFQDPPEHGANRRALSAAFSPAAKAVDARLPDLATETLAGLDRGRPFDLVADFGRPFTGAVMAALLGVDRDELPDLLTGADAFFRLFAPIPDAATLAAMNDGLAALRAQARAIVARQLDRRTDGVARALARTAPTGAAPDVGAIADSCLLLFADGIENVQFAIATAWTALGARPDLLARARQDRALMGLLGAEALRLHAPAQSIPRIARETLLLGDTEIRRDMPVHLSLGSANRDPGVFPDPDDWAVEPGYAREKALTFGAGRHACIGGRLAGAMLTAALEGLSEAGAVALERIDTLTFLPRFGHRWPRAAQARLAPA